MLFNSYAFIFAFLPVTLLGFFGLARRSHWLAATWLTLASLFFYGWWNPAYVGLLAASIAMNFFAGVAIARARAASGPARLWLVAAVVANLALLAWFKYANFFVDSVAGLFGTDWSLAAIVLPLGISFFTFTQIAYLVDTYRGEVKEVDPVHYTLFVTYFPHLIAGPVLHHREMMPQFGHGRTYVPTLDNLAVGLTIFCIGLFKKVVLADNVAAFANPVFAAAGQGDTLTLLESWGGVLAYTLQIYFDFSGYSDMAIGASRLFGITLPLNFNSPYKATNIAEFWRRWHMTLSRFLRDYLYIGLGGNRKGPQRRYVNLFITMLLGGLWHGAGWTFVVWGALHGAYLCVHQAWTALRKTSAHAAPPTRLGRVGATLLTFLAVVVGWVFFRATSVEAAWSILASMVGLHGVVLPTGWQASMGPTLAGGLQGLGAVFGDPGLFKGSTELAWIVALLAIAWWAPNTQQIMAGHAPALDWRDSGGARWLQWRPNAAWATAIGCAALVSIASLTEVSQFLYFQF
jgi:alginate O-acetyltransferase complex protein AlgI